MNIADLTADQQALVLHHLRSAAMARALQWDHEAAIERILDREIDIEISDIAGGVDADASTLTPEDLTFITLEDLTSIIPDEK